MFQSVSGHSNERAKYSSFQLMTNCVAAIKCLRHYGFVPLGWSGSGSVIQDLSGFNGFFDTPWSRQILDHWSWSRSPQRNAPYVKLTWESLLNHKGHKFPTSLTLLSFKTRIEYNRKFSERRFQLLQCSRQFPSFRLTGFLWWQKLSLFFSIFFKICRFRSLILLSL